VTEQKPLRTGPSDKHVEGGTSTNKQKAMDAAKLGLSPQKLDKSTLSRGAARGERLKELAGTVRWGEDTDQGEPSSAFSEAIELEALPQQRAENYGLHVEASHPSLVRIYDDLLHSSKFRELSRELTATRRLTLLEKQMVYNARYYPDDHAIAVFPKTLDSGEALPLLFPGRFVAKAAWEGRREPESQPISWTTPMVWPQLQRLASPSVLACVPNVVLVRT
jgi:hypothetical protein